MTEEDLLIVEIKVNAKTGLNLSCLLEFFMHDITEKTTSNATDKR